MHILNIDDNADFVIDSEFVIGDDIQSIDTEFSELDDPLELLCALEEAIETGDYVAIEELTAILESRH